jgi:hypothetical protein
MLAGAIQRLSAKVPRVVKPETTTKCLMPKRHFEQQESQSSSEFQQPANQPNGKTAGVLAIDQS